MKKLNKEQKGYSFIMTGIFLFLSEIASAILIVKWNYTFLFFTVLFTIIIFFSRGIYLIYSFYAYSNKRHPERMKDEVFITNSGLDSYWKVGWKTKRTGTIAYDVHGERCGNFPHFFPVFVDMAEIKNSEEGDRILKDLLP